MSGGRKEENTSGGIYYVQGKGGGRLEKWPYLADKCPALRNNDKLGPFLTKTPRCLGFLVFHILSGRCCSGGGWDKTPEIKGKPHGGFFCELKEIIA
jgi:hypothetical protein